MEKIFRALRPDHSTPAHMLLWFYGLLSLWQILYALCVHNTWLETPVTVHK